MGWQADSLPAQFKWMSHHLKKQIHLYGLQFLKRLSAGRVTFAQVLRLQQLTSRSKQMPSSTGLNDCLPLIITWNGLDFYLKAISSINTQISFFPLSMVSMLEYPPSNKPLPQRIVAPSPLISMNSVKLSPSNLNKGITLVHSHKYKLKKLLGLSKLPQFLLSLKLVALAHLSSSRTYLTHEIIYQYLPLINILYHKNFLAHGKCSGPLLFSFIILHLAHKQQFEMWLKLIGQLHSNLPNGQMWSFVSMMTTLLPSIHLPGMPQLIFCSLKGSAQCLNGLMIIFSSASSNAIYPITISNKVSKQLSLPEWRVHP